jgi:hypothetical protein
LVVALPVTKNWLLFVVEAAAGRLGGNRLTNIATLNKIFKQWDRFLLPDGMMFPPGMSNRID